MPAKTYLEISLSTILKTAFVILLMFFSYLLKDVILSILTAIVVASAMDPGVRWFEKKKFPRIFGVVIIYLLVLVIFAFIVLFFLPIFLGEASSVISNIPTYLSQVNNIIPLLDESFLEGYVPLVKELALRIQSAGFVTSLTKGNFSASKTVFDSASALGSGLLSFVLVAVLAFYFSVTKDGVSHFLRIITPARHESYVISMWERTKEKIGAWMQGQIFLGVIVGSLVFLMLAIAGIPHAFILGVLAGLLEIIPVFGPTLAAIPGITIALLFGGLGFGMYAFIVYLLIQLFENHLFYPAVVKKMVGVSPIIVILALVIGIKLAGFMGALLSIPASVLLVEFLNDMDKKKSLSRQKEV